MIRSLLAMVGLLMMVVCQAEANSQELLVKDGDTITVQVSARELTRVSVEGAGRLEKVWGAAGVMEINPDKDKGEVFIRPLPGAPASFSFFVRDDQGATYTLLAKQSDIPSQTIMLKPANIKISSLDKSRWKSRPYLENLKHLIKAMAKGDELSGYTVEMRMSRVPIWKETEIRQVRAYVGFALVGEVYTIENKTDEVLKFHEQEFMDFGEDVKAVSLEKLEVAPGETTVLYIVRRIQEG